MIYLKQSTASQSVLIGPFVDDSDGATPETALSIANTDIRLSPNGGNMVAKNSGGGTHDEAGMYSITLDATDTATVGSLQLSVKVTGALYVFHDFQVLEETIYDKLFGSGATGDLGVDVVKISGDSTAADNLELITELSRGVTINSTGGSAGKDADDLIDDVWDEAASGHNTGGSFGKAIRQTKEASVSIESTVNDLSASTTSFVTDLTEATDDHYTDVSIVFIDGNLAGQSRPILSYNGTTKAITLDEALTEAPADGDAFIIKTGHIHPISQVLTTQMTESYAADGTAPTLAQALFNIQQTLGDFSITGTTITVKKLDGSTTAMTYTLDDATTPTSRTRAT